MRCIETPFGEPHKIIAISRILIPKSILGKRGVELTCHDLAHWCVAAPKRRALPDFGLGDGSNLFFSTGGRREREERYAIVVGTGLLWYLGFQREALRHATQSELMNEWEPEPFAWNRYGRRAVVALRRRKLWPPERAWKQIAKAVLGQLATT